MNEIPPNPRVLARYRAVVAAAGGTENHILQKSSLYQRLLDDKRPFALPPPLNHSYPWYSVIESETPLPLPFAPSDWSPDWDSRSGIAINQDVWTKLDGDVARDLTVTFPGWHELGFVWRVWQADEPAEITQALLCCWHRDDVSKLTTPELVEAECRWRIERTASWVAESEKLDDEAFKAAYLASGQAGKAGDKFGELLSEQHLKSCRSIAQERLSAGLSLEYTQDEIDLQVAESVTDLMGDSWFARDGKLYHRTWLIQRILPTALAAEHYLEPA